ncbi:MAG TPA: hypothetical protein VG052_09595 [Puia sp.]|jgi:hypothetical protein|nr:hypothetical protein [Puia sp.]
MKLRRYLLFFLLTAGGSAYAQTRPDSTFSLLLNSSLSFTHANDAHINRWLKEYGYPTEPHTPVFLNFEVAAIPADSRLLYSVHLSTITNADDLTSFNIGAGLYAAPVKTKSFLLFFGGALGYHADIITLDGNLPPDYKALAEKYHTSLSLRRCGLSIEPAMRVLWYPIRLGQTLQVGVFGGLGYDVDLNSRWRLGYYTNTKGRYDHFSKINKPSDQVKVSEYGFALNAGLSFRLNLH